MAQSGGIVLEETPSKGRYVYRDGDGPEAELTFSKAGSALIIIDHTEVPDAFRGRNVGFHLVERAVADARAAGKKIVPLCRRHPEWADVLN
jgi:uncharacterized protein